MWISVALVYKTTSQKLKTDRWPSDKCPDVAVGGYEMFWSENSIKIVRFVFDGTKLWVCKCSVSAVSWISNYYTLAFSSFFLNFFFLLSNYTEPRKYNCSKNSLHTPRSITIYLFPTQHYDTPKMSCASSDFLYLLRKLFMTKLTGFFVFHIRRARYDCFGTRSSGLRTWYQRRQCTSS